MLLGFNDKVHRGTHVSFATIDVLNSAIRSRQIAAQRAVVLGGIGLSLVARFDGLVKLPQFVSAQRIE